MLNRKYAIAAMLTGLTILSTAIPVAAEMKFSSACLNQNGVYVIVGQSSDCNIPGVPDINLPEFPETPEQPEIPELPGTPEQPEIPENNSFAMQIIELVNQEREKEGLPAVQYDSNIEKAALVRAKETETSFSHTRPNGSSFSTALKENGVSFQGAGENIAWGQKSPEEVMRGWMNSPGHRANIMNKNFTKIGVGYYQNSNGVNYWTQLFTY